jgi:XTP/dITP diphosphohydrolase
MQTKILAATGNTGKIKEIRAILAPINLNIITPYEISLEIDVAETGTTYLVNARLKAEAYHNATGLPVLADDSGLEVAALEGAPGIHSARFSPIENANDADRRAHLIRALQAKTQPWKAHFHCTAVLYLPGRVLIHKTGECHGIIIPEERGEYGFGYDPIFFIPEYQRTMAEIDPSIKNKISHRAKALTALMPEITRYVK